MGRGANNSEDGLSAKRPIVSVIDEGPIAGEDLFLDEQAAQVLHDWVGRWPEECSFKLVRVSLDSIQGGRFHPPEMYLADDDRDGYRVAIELKEAYAEGRDVPPIVLCEITEIEGLNVVDGCHRLVAANAAGLGELDAYLLIS